MIVGIDGTRGINEKAGIGRYTYNLVKAMTENKDVNAQFLFTAMRGKKQKIKEIKKVVDGRRFVVKSIPGEWKNSIWGGPVSWPDLWMPQVNLWHAPSIWEAPLATKKPLVITIHDMTPFLFPQLRGRKVSKNQQCRTLKAVRKADHVICISKATRDDLVKYIPQASEKISIVPLGLEPGFELLNYIKKEKIILAVGTIEPRKNLKLLFNAYSKLSPALQKEYKIWVVGAKGWNDSPIFEAAQKLGDRVHFWGYVSDKKLIEIFNHAEIFAFPSLYEGFGLPLVEAMACGLPVIANNISSIPEVVGDAALLLPDEVSAWTAGLTRLMTDTALRKKLRDKGFGQAKQFTWSKTATATADVYRKVMAARQN